VTVVDLYTKYPLVYHMATVGSWPSILRHGLLSTSALLDLFEVHGEQRASIETRRRPTGVKITHEAVGAATIRDQKALHVSMLERCLQGSSTVEDWLRLLNGRVFFWVDEKRLNDLRNARAYHDERQTVIFADTRALVTRYQESVRLAHINTGATRSVSHFRSPETFKTIPAFDQKKVVELTIGWSVPDIADFVVSVEEIGGPSPARTIWERAGAT
jgi:hypothetical protein